MCQQTETGSKLPDLDVVYWSTSGPCTSSKCRSSQAMIGGYLRCLAHRHVGLAGSPAAGRTWTRRDHAPFVLVSLALTLAVGLVIIAVKAALALAVLAIQRLTNRSHTRRPGSLTAKKQQIRTHKYRKDELTLDKPLGHKAFRITSNGN